MDIQMIVNIASFAAALAAIWVVFFSKTLPTFLNEIARRQRTNRFIIGFLVLIIPLVDWGIHFSSSNTELGWYDWIIIGLGASAISLLLLPEPSWLNIVGEVVLGPIGAFLGGLFFVSHIRMPNFYVSIAVILVSTLALMTLLRLIEYYIHEVRDGNGDDRLTVGALFLIEVIIVWGILSASSLTTNLSWYHYVTIGLGASALSLIIPGGHYGFNIIGETLIGPIGAFIGGWLVNPLLSPHAFYTSVGILFLCALALMIVFRLLYYLYQSIRSDTEGGA